MNTPAAAPQHFVSRHVVVAATGGPAIAARIREARPDLEVRERAPADVTADDLAWADTLVAFRVPPNAGTLGNVRWIQSTGAGVDPWLVPGTLPDGVLLTRSSESYGPMIAEWVVSRLFAIQLQVLPLYDAQRRSEWVPREIARVAGTHAVLLGTGDIGRATANALHALGVRVTGVSRSGTSGHPAFDRVLPVSALADVVGEADWLIVSTPDTPETRGLVSRDVLSRCANAVLINAGRGAVVEETALPEALEKGWLRGAALDVFVQEPLPASSPLWSDPRVIVSPHISGLTTAAGAAQAFVDNLRELEAGRFPSWTVDRSRGY
ncbi:MAG: D-2-hydroxyacid dehydrogenase [Gemmatimonadaceae bacterium]|nr:D-2-hydroxyacid dehydrogenase [Gemmatimonadaceae bacterium]